MEGADELWDAVDSWKANNPWYEYVERITKFAEECQRIMDAATKPQYETFTSGSSGTRFRWNPDAQCYEEYYPEEEEN
jgi:hypothetical protein